MADPLLDYLEKTFADSYRKEIDQEENVWRTLPFFTAALAFQLATLAAIRDWLIGAGSATLSLLALATTATFAAVVCLLCSIWPADFRYITSEPELQDYAEQVQRTDARSADPATAAGGGDQVLLALKALLAEQYAEGADNNRRINQRRAKWRMRAGVAILVAILAMLVLVTSTVLSHVVGYARVTAAGSQTHATVARPAELQRRHPAADDGGAQGMVPGPGHSAPGQRTSGGGP